MQLGPFALDRPVGRGGMGVVWRGHHVRLRLPVAVKFLRPTRDPWRSSALEAEIRALAGLSHPGIVAVLDTGLAPEGLAEVEPGSPFLVEEWVGGGDLRRCPPSSWERLRALGLELLDALAHAHARGLLHRDLKPGNVLRGDDGRWRLVDFGVARMSGLRPEADSVAGTPAFMAPEQVVGDWRAEGPGTDLYALGCLIWSLVTGAPPHVGEPASVMRAHLTRPLPFFRPSFPVPEGLEAWLRTALERDPAWRWRLAADAAAALATIGGPLGEVAPAPKLAAPAVGGAEDGQETWAFSDASPPVAQAASFARSAEPLPPRPAPPAPWPHPDPRSPPILDAGIRLVAWRSPPLVGRDAERGALWDTLGRVRAEGGVAIARVRGPTGVGCTSLLEGLAEVAHATGMALPLRVGSQGLGAAVLQALGLHELSAEEAALRLDRQPRLAESALLPLLRGERGAPRRQVVLALQALVALDGGRPVLLVLDGLGAKDPRRLILEALAAGGEGLPPLMVIYTESEGEEPAPEPWAVDPDLRLGPLDAGAMVALLDALIPLEAGARATLVARSGGLPRLARDLLNDLLARGALTESPEGYRLSADERLSAPANLTEAWSGRYTDVTDRYGVDVRLGLELLATWGRPAPPAVWSALCAEAGLHAGALADPELHRAGLLAREEGGLDLPHPLARDALRALAHAACREPRWSAIAARVLEEQGMVDPERLGRHLLAAGDDAAALAPLLQAANWELGRGAFASGLALLRLRAAAMDRLGLPPADPARRAAWEPEFMALRVLHQLEEAESLAAARLALARAAGDPVARVVLLREQALLHEGRGRVEEALGLMREARAEAALLGPGRLLGSVTFFLAGMLRRQNALEEAEQLGRELVVMAEQVGGGRPLRTSLRFQGELAAVLGRPEEARAAISRALALARADQDLEEIGRAENALGELERQAGRLEAAVSHYRAAIASLRAGGLPPDGAVWLNLAQVLLASGRQAEAWTVAERVLHSPSGADQAYVILGARLVLAAAAAREGRLPELDLHFAEAEQLFARTGLFDPDFVALARQIAGASGAAGERAGRALALAAAMEVRRGR